VSTVPTRAQSERLQGLTGGRRPREPGPTLRRGALAALVFGAGIGALATEITASRLLAPYFGSSTIVWANLIGIVLAALALGYWLGGRIADRRPQPSLLGSIVLAAAICVAAIPFVAEPFLDLTVEGLDEASAGAVVGSFVAVLLLCAPPVVLLGMVSPFAIRLAVSSVETAGAVAGRLYALSTAGSLLGTFLPALVLIPAIGTQRTFLVVAVLLAVSSCFLLGARYLVVAALVAALVAVPPGAVKPKEGLLHEETTYHQYIQVVEEDDGRRLLYLNEGIAVHSVWRPDSVLTGGVWDAFLALPPLLGRPLERVAILGNAAGTTARALGVYYPRAEIDGVELDPAVSDVGRRYFGLEDNPRLDVHDADARPFLRRSDERYDLVVVDAYHQPYVPFYLATREFFALVRERLAPGGIIALNVATVPDDERLVRAIGRTVAAELPQVLSWPALRFNTLVLGLSEPLARVELERRLRAGPSDLAPLRRLLAREVAPLEASGRPWTDDHAPVEWLTDRMIISYAAEGGRLDEDYLPTRPSPSSQ
jgi:spermidine synthase